MADKRLINIFIVIAILILFVGLSRKVPMCETNCITGVTSVDDGSTHTFSVDADGNGMTSINGGHKHNIETWIVETIAKHNHNLEEQ